MWNPIVQVDGHAVSVLGVATLGATVGYIAGMFGIGGGFLLTPLLVVIFHVPLPIAVGTGLCQMLGTSLVAFLRHRKVQQGEPRFDLLMLPGSLLGVTLGTRTLSTLAGLGSLTVLGRSIPWVNLVVESCYLVLLSSVAVNYWRHSSGGADVFSRLRPGPLSRMHLGPATALPVVGLQVSPIVVAYLGLALGFLSGLVGIGGGVALNPILLYGYGFPIRHAVGTGILVLVATALAGTITHARAGHVHLLLAMVMLVGATITAQFGALASKRLSGSALGKIHALVIAAAIAAVLWDLVAHVH